MSPLRHPSADFPSEMTRSYPSASARIRGLDHWGNKSNPAFTRRAAGCHPSGVGTSVSDAPRAAVRRHLPGRGANPGNYPNAISLPP
jgi:hypothetical protein